MVTFEQPWLVTSNFWDVFNGQVEGHPAYKNLLESYKGKMNRLTSHVLGVKMPDAAILCGIKLVHDWMPAADDQANYFWVLVAMALSARGCLAWNFVKWVGAAAALKEIATGRRVKYSEEPRTTLTKILFSSGPDLPVGCASEALKQVQLYRESLGKINKRGKISSLETEAAEKLLQALLTNNHQSLVELIPSDVKLTEHDKYLQKQLAQQQQQSAQPKESAAGRQTRSQSLHHACKAPTLAESLRKDAKLMEDLQSAKHLLNLFTLQAVCTDRSEAEKLVDKHIVLLEKLFANNSGFLKRQVAEARQREEMLLELHSCTSDRRLLDDEDRRSVLYTLSSLTGVPYPPLSGNTQDAGGEMTGDMLVSQQPPHVTKLLAIMEIPTCLEVAPDSPSEQPVDPSDSQLHVPAGSELRPMEAIAELCYHSLAAKLCPDVMIAPAQFCIDKVKLESEEMLCLSISTPYAGLDWVQVKLKLLRLAQAADLSVEQQQHMLAFAAVCCFRTMAILLDRLHSQCFLHNDVKPENMVLLGSHAADDCLTLLHLMEDPSKSRFIDAGAMLSAVPIGIHEYVYNLKTTGGTTCFQSPELNSRHASFSSLTPREAAQQTDAWSMAMAGMRLAFLSSESADDPLERRAEILRYCSIQQQQGCVDVTALKGQWLELLKEAMSSCSQMFTLLDLFSLCTHKIPGSRWTPQMLLEQKRGDINGLVSDLKGVVHGLFDR